MAVTEEGTELLLQVDYYLAGIGALCREQACIWHLERSCPVC